MGLANFLSMLLTGAESGLKKSLDTFNTLEAADGTIFVAKDSSLMTMIRIDGTQRMIGNAEMAEILDTATARLSSPFRDPGHALQFWFMRDPDASGPMLNTMLQLPRQVSDRLGLNLGDVFEERARILPRYIVREKGFIALWTRLSILPKRELERVRATTASPPLWPKMVDAQYPFRLAQTLRVRHEAFVSGFLNTLREFGLRGTAIDGVEALNNIRSSIYPELDDSPWRPVVTRGAEDGDEGSAFRMPFPRYPEQGAGDISHFMHPTISSQIFPKGVKTLGGALVRVGDRVFSGVDMTIGPQNITVFNDLLNRLRAMGEFPWRVSFLLEGDGLRGTSLKSLLAAICGPTNGENRMLRGAIKALQEYRIEGGVVTKLRISFATWGPANNPAIVEDRISRLQRAVEGWGYCGVAPIAGDPLEGVMSSALGLSCSSTAVAGAVPLRDAILMMPWVRDASPFGEGSVLFRTVDGRPWPYQPGSNLQTTWIDLVYGPPGKGKSVWLNTTNLSFCLSPTAVSGSGGAMLPRIAIIDIGMSSSGLISLLREGLPPSRQHEVLYRKLRMHKDDAINPFDTQLGLRGPLPIDKSFLENFLTTLCTDPGKPVPNGLPGLIGMVVNEAYEQFSDQTRTGTPKIYVAGVEPIIDDGIKTYDIALRSNMTWWHLVDAFFAKGAFREALTAQRYAVPLLEDLPAIAATAKVEDIYGQKSVDGEPIIKMFSRLISESLRFFPILRDVTRVDFGSARVVSLDLQDAAPKGGQAADKQTALVYMLARFVLARDFYLNTDDITADTTMPDIYREYHRERVQRIRETPKKLVLDEFHRTSSAAAVRQQVIIDMREGRKWGVQIVLASQLLHDFDQDMLSLATGFWIMGCTTEQDRKDAAERFGLSRTAQATLPALNGPSAEWGGAPFLAVLDMKDGLHEHLLINTLGPIELWAFSTTSDDVALRNRLYERVGPSLARATLARRFPGGSAKDEIERRKRLLSSGPSITEEQQAGVIGSLAEELAAIALMSAKN